MQTPYRILKICTRKALHIRQQKGHVRPIWRGVSDSPSADASLGGSLAGGLGGRAGGGSKENSLVSVFFLTDESVSKMASPLLPVRTLSKPPSVFKFSGDFRIRVPFPRGKSPTLCSRVGNLASNCFASAIGTFTSMRGVGMGEPTGGVPWVAPFRFVTSLRT